MSVRTLQHLAPRLSFACPPALLGRLAARYAEPHRRYHTEAHIVACFAARAALTSAPSAAVDLALLFHDAVYEPLAADNEARSAELLLTEGLHAGVDEATLNRAAELVLATRHAGESTLEDADMRLVLDADLSILGAAPAAFAEYERDVRVEYACVPEAAYAAGRAQILRRLLARPTLFLTEGGRQLWEAQARRNVAGSVARLIRVERPDAR